MGKFLQFSKIACLTSTIAFIAAFSGSTAILAQTQQKQQNAQPPSKNSEKAEEKKTPKKDVKKLETPIGGAWSTETQATKKNAKAPSEGLDPDRVQTVEKINAYFNEITNLKGKFVQTNPNNEKTKGKFYVQRPGRLRFDYAAPSKLRIVSDGKWIAIEDHDLQTFDRYRLEKTPFRLLLADKVDLLRDARINDYFKGDDLIILTLTDKSDEANGRIKLFFSINPELQLKEWIITDPQGLDTRIQIANLVLGEKTDPGFFKLGASDLKAFSD